MKFSILLSILFDLLSQRKLTAAYLSEKYQISARTVYRYVEILQTVAPVSIKRGRSGGVCLADNYKLPVGFMSQEEYDAVIEALTKTYAEQPEERFLTAKRKLSSQIKLDKKEATFSSTPNSLYIDGSAWFDTDSFLNKLRVLEECIDDKKIAEIDFSTAPNARNTLRIEPHLLVFKQNAWYVYAFSHKSRSFELFPFGHVFSATKMEESFRKRPFKKNEIFLEAWNSERRIEVRLKVQAKALQNTVHIFGVENIRSQKDGYYANITLPDDETLPYKILSLGADVEVVSPQTVKSAIQKIIRELSAVYSIQE